METEHPDDIEVEIISDPPRPDHTRFIRACRREVVDRTPIWLMRQAGRYMPEYRALRKKYSILELIRNPDMAAVVTMQPVNAFDVDAAIIFSDILVVLEALGLPIEFVAGEGPRIISPIRSAADVERLVVRQPEEMIGFTLEALSKVKEKIHGQIALLGFSGAPFTLACYAIEGGGSRDFKTAKQFMRDQPDAWHKLMNKLSLATGEYLQAQLRSRADALQLFDTWAGLLSPMDYQRFVMPHTKQAIDIALDERKVPLIHFGTTPSIELMQLMREAGGDVIGVDWRHDIAHVWQQFNYEVAVQGNLDPTIMLGHVQEVQREATRILESIRGRPGHIFNLGHGVIKETPPENVAALIEAVHGYRPL